MSNRYDIQKSAARDSHLFCGRGLGKRRKAAEKRRCRRYRRQAIKAALDIDDIKEPRPLTGWEVC